MRKFITTEQKQTIINLYEKGNSAYKIAKELSIDNSSIFLNRKKEKISNHITKRLELYSSPLLEEELRKRNFIPHFQS